MGSFAGLENNVCRQVVVDGFGSDARADWPMLDIVEYLPDATFVVDTNRRVVAWNRALEEMTGVSKEEMIGQGDHAYAIPFYGVRRPILIDLIDEDLDRIDHFYPYISRDGRTLFMETFIRKLADRENRFLWGTASPLLDKHGNTIGGIESIRDITEYKQAEIERSRLEAQLHHSRMMEVFMMQLGHDLKTPLTPLFTLLPMVKESVSEQRYRRMLDICCKSIENIKEMTDKTLKLVRLSSVFASDMMTQVNLSRLVDDCIVKCGAVLVRHNVTCTSSIDAGFVIHGVPEQLQELFVNLIANGACYSHPGGIVRISAECCGNQLTVSVRDDGIGLAPEHLELIFDEFYKVDESRHNLDSPGLGLAICKRIVQNHKGSIRAESQGLGLGMTIIMTLPLLTES